MKQNAIHIQSKGKILFLIAPFFKKEQHVAKLKF